METKVAKIMEGARIEITDETELKSLKKERDELDSEYKIDSTKYTILSGSVLNIREDTELDLLVITLNTGYKIFVGNGPALEKAYLEL